MVGCCKTSWCWNPLVLQLLTGHNVPVNVQQDKPYSLSCNFLSLYEWENVIPVKVKTLRTVFLYISGYRQHF